jgi:hypothetical protein
MVGALGPERHISTRRPSSRSRIVYLDCWLELSSLAITAFQAGSVVVSRGVDVMSGGAWVVEWKQTQYPTVMYG